MTNLRFLSRNIPKMSRCVSLQSFRCILWHVFRDNHPESKHETKKSTFEKPCQGFVMSYLNILPISYLGTWTARVGTATMSCLKWFDAVSSPYRRMQHRREHDNICRKTNHSNFSLPAARNHKALLLAFASTGSGRNLQHAFDVHWCLRNNSRRSFQVICGGNATSFEATARKPAADVLALGHSTVTCTIKRTDVPNESPAPACGPPLRQPAWSQVDLKYFLSKRPSLDSAFEKRNRPTCVNGLGQHEAQLSICDPIANTRTCVRRRVA